MRQYSGRWSLSQLAQAISDQNWPGQPPQQVEYLVVAGGGGGGASNAGGGGGGGLLAGFSGVSVGSSITVTVGGGGAGGVAGSNSVFGIITATGGGFGGTGSGAASANGGGNGGSGGGSGQATARSAGAPGSGISGQGNAGGSPNNSFQFDGGGGGGAGTVGLNQSADNIGGNGGAGIASDISGTRTTYAGGGGGAGDTTGGTGGAGGGGNGGTTNVGPTAGTAYTGGGGGGLRSAGSSAAGGAGIVIISYPDTYSAAKTTTGSPSITTSGSGSISFNGSTQYVGYPAISNYNLGSGNFTVELFFYPTGSQSNGVVLASQAINIYYPPWMFYFAASNTLQFYSSSNGSSFDVASGATIGTYTPNAWNHAVICRSGASIRCYLNGVLGSTTTTSATLVNATTPLFLAMRAPGVDPYFNGYITNFRLVKGTALYTDSSLTVPTAPLTAVTNTQLLVSAVSGSYLVDSSSNAAIATPTGSSPWNQLSPFATGGGYKNRVYTWTSSGSITF